jgi:hypothetical protein
MPVVLREGGAAVRLDAYSSIIRRVMPKRAATISAVDPIDTLTFGSVRPLSRAITGTR